ncbi:MAG: hypothetical protein EBS29_00140 [Chloroflexia bacterium]|nr:hypothetical protein [Chloroflexia bacterium]
MQPQHLMTRGAPDAPPTTPTSMWQLVRLILTEYVHSQRIFIEWGSALGITLLLIRDSINIHTMMATWTLAGVLVALYTTSVLADIADQPLQLQRLLAVQSRRAYICAFLIAANVIVVSSYLLTIVLSYFVAPLAHPTIPVVITSMLNMVLLLSVITTVMLMLTPLVANTQQRIVVLLVLTIPLAWNIIGPAIQRVLGPNSTPLVTGLSTLWGILLWPTLHLYTSTVTPQIDQMMLAIIVFHLCLLVILVRQLIVWFNKKSLAIA